MQGRVDVVEDDSSSAGGVIDRIVAAGAVEVRRRRPKRPFGVFVSQRPTVGLYQRLRLFCRCVSVSYIWPVKPNRQVMGRRAALGVRHVAEGVEHLMRHEGVWVETDFGVRSVPKSKCLKRLGQVADRVQVVRQRPERRVVGSRSSSVPEIIYVLNMVFLVGKKLIH